MRRLILTGSWFFLVCTISASEYQYSLGAGGGLARLTGGGFFNFDDATSVNISLGHCLADNWWLDLEFSTSKISNNVGSDSTGTIGAIWNNSLLDIEITRLGVDVSRTVYAPWRGADLSLGIGGGLMVWKGLNPESNTAYEVRGSKDETTDFAASELFLSALAGLTVRPAARWSVKLTSRADYHTGAGAEFESTLTEARDRWLLMATGKLYFHFGRRQARSNWPSDQVWAQQPGDAPAPTRIGRDSDGDGVIDRDDDCLNTPRGAIVDAHGCPVDSDRDGVVDGLDDCPATVAAAQGRVDIHGCPVDSDFDGVPDFRDACPFNRVGSEVDENGCPVDSDGDGVSNGLDDCPYTLTGLAVDKFGCIDLEMFSRPMVLNIDYPSGSFEIDPRSRERIKRLAGLLNFVKDIKLDINGYTDDIGMPLANRSLSEKRAWRVQGYLKSLGIEEERMKVFGRGETNFIASNRTAEGRAKNRRIEIIFYR